jgi:predicted nucleic acid-binding protein
MVLIDTNAVLRFILADIPEQHETVRAVIANQEVAVRHEIIAEAVYVLTSLYQIPKKDAAELLEKFLCTKNVLSQDPTVLLRALNLFATHNLAFVDSILLAYCEIKGCDVLTFDKKLLAKLKQL